MITHRRIGIAVVGLVAALLLAACAGEEPEALTPTAEQAPVDVSQSPEPTPVTEAPAPESAVIGTVASVVADAISPLDSPDGDPVADLTNPMREGVPLVFLVVGEQGDWLEVQLPIRPNGSTGWIRSSEVQLSTLTYALEVSIEDRTLSLLQDGEVLETYSAAVGTGDTPTPTGDYFLTELIRPTNAGYGPYAFGVSAFSDVLNSFGGGPGQIGVHGTPDEGSIGQAASHGCIRLNNDDITYLAGILPLGTPISIV